MIHCSKEGSCCSLKSADVHREGAVAVHYSRQLLFTGERGLWQGRDGGRRGAAVNRAEVGGRREVEKRERYSGRKGKPPPLLPEEDVAATVRGRHCCWYWRTTLLGKKAIAIIHRWEERHCHAEIGKRVSTLGFFLHVRFQAFCDCVIDNWFNRSNCLAFGLTQAWWLIDSIEQDKLVWFNSSLT